LQRYPTGWEWHASPTAAAALLTLSALFGLVLPLQVAALSRARGAAGSLSATGGAFFGVLSVSCCAPQLVPALLGFAGFSGTAILTFNGAVRQFALPLTLLTLASLVLSIALFIRTLTVACELPPSKRAPA
ncbi:MAG: hypothetical protein JO247_15385, partial [Chloroflexi bacterium]|nr:hypothetical protein [Chloroflexota bacterium]